MKLLLDTNVLIDLLEPREPYASDVRKLCIAAEYGDVQLWSCVQSFADAYYVLTRRGATEDAVKKALLALLDFFTPCNTYASALRPALSSDWQDVEDYLIAYSSKSIGADLLITRDKEMSALSPVRAMTAHEFLKMMEEDHGLAYDEVDLP